jgi:hypothetical protein
MGEPGARSQAVRVMAKCSRHPPSLTSFDGKRWALVSFSELTRCLLHVVTCNDPDIRAIMELTQDRVTDVVAGFWRKNSDHRCKPLICAQLHNLSDMTQSMTFKTRSICPRGLFGSSGEHDLLPDPAFFLHLQHKKFFLICGFCSWWRVREGLRARRGLDGRSNFEQNGGALAPLLQSPLAHFL